MIDKFEMVNPLQVAKKTAQKSKTILTDIERWQKVIGLQGCFMPPFFFSFGFACSYILYMLTLSVFYFQGVASTDGEFMLS